MSVEIKVSNINFGEADGRPSAVVTFRVSAQPGGGRVAEDFSVDVGILGETDPSTTAHAARHVLGKLAVDMVNALPD